MLIKKNLFKNDYIISRISPNRDTYLRISVNAHVIALFGREDAWVARRKHHQRGSTLLGICAFGICVKPISPELKLSFVSCLHLEYPCNFNFSKI